jgi:hypothetical protein
MSLTFHKLVIDSNLTGTYAGLQNYDQSTMNIDDSDPWVINWSTSNKGFALDCFQKGVILSNGVITLESSFDIPGVRSSRLHEFETFCPFGFYFSDNLFVESQKMDFKKGILETNYKFIRDEEVVRCVARIFVSQNDVHVVQQELLFDKPNIKVYRKVYSKPNIYGIQYHNGVEYQEDSTLPTSMQMLSGEATLADSHRTAVAFASSYTCDDMEYLGMKRTDYGATCYEVIKINTAFTPVKVATVLGSEKDFEKPYDKLRVMLTNRKEDGFIEQENAWKVLWNRGTVEVAGSITNALRAALYELWVQVRPTNYVDSDKLLSSLEGMAYILPLYVMMRPSVAKTMIEHLPHSPLLAFHAWNCYRASGDKNWLRLHGFPVIERAANDISRMYMQNDEPNGLSAFDLYVNKAVIKYAMQAAYVLHLQVFYDWRSADNLTPLTKFSQKSSFVLEFSDKLNPLILMPYYSEIFLQQINIDQETVINSNLNAINISNIEVDKAILGSLYGILGQKNKYLGVIQDLEDRKLTGIWKQFDNKLTAAKYLWLYIEGGAQLQVVGHIEESGFASQGMGLNYVPENILPWRTLKVMTERRGLFITSK